MSRGVGRTCMSPSWSTSTLLPGREYSTPSLPTLGTGSCRLAQSASETHRHFQDGGGQWPRGGVWGGGARGSVG